MAGDITHGMNIEQVKTLAQQLSQKAEAINTIMTEVNSALTNTSWVGPDAESFKNRWQQEGVRQLTAAKEILTTASQAANRNATDQTTASEATSGNF